MDENEENELNKLTLEEHFEYYKKNRIRQKRYNKEDCKR